MADDSFKSSIVWLGSLYYIKLIWLVNFSLGKTDFSLLIHNITQIIQLALLFGKK